MRYTGPRNKIARREMTDLGLKTPGTKSHANLLKRINILPGQHGVKRRRRLTERGFQLREKQKLRFMFGLTERQLKNYFKRAIKKKGNTALFLAEFLEKRLDNVVYRLGFAPTRAAARQLVSHRHIKVNNETVNIPSYQVKVADKISFSNDKVLNIPYVKTTLSNKNIIIPKWLKRKNFVGQVVTEPGLEDLEKQVNLRRIIEYYSR